MFVNQVLFVTKTLPVKFVDFLECWNVVHYVLILK